MELTAAIGKRLKGLREEAGVRQEDIAVAARACGLAWGRSTVAMLEGGKRRLDPQELLLLPVILQVAQVGSLTLLELLAGDDETVELTPEAKVPRSGLAELLDPATDLATLNMRNWYLPGLLLGAEVLERWAESPARNEPQPWEWRQRGLTADQLETIRRESAGEAERVAARKLGVDPYALAEAARWLWGRSLTATRDARAAQIAAADQLEGAESLRAVRGHVTRELVDEIRAHLKGTS